MITRSLRTTLLITAALPVWGLVALAQETVAPTPAPEVEPTVASAPVAAPEAKVPAVKAQDTLSVDFPDEEIRNVLRNVADLFELNLVIPDTLQGKTSIKLRDVTWRQIYAVILEPVGYTFIEEGNIIKVVTRESLNLEPLTTEVFILNYAKAAEIKPALLSLVDTKVGGKIIEDARSNSLVVSERASMIQKMRPIIIDLDRPTEQVMIESKFIEVTNADIKNIGVNWSSLNGYRVGAGEISRKWTDSRGRTYSTGIGEKDIDVNHMQNGYERADTLANRNGGPALGDTTSGIGPPYTLDSATGTRTYDDFGPSSNLSKLFNNDLTKVTSAVLSADQFGVVISALKTKNDTKLISNPTVVTLNNTEASINMGDEIPIPNFTYNQERGVFEISGFTYKPVGVLLKVTPQVNNAGFIKLTVEPEVSSTDKAKDRTFGAAVLPVITTRRTRTQVTLKDGYTLGIGGMVQRSDSKGETRVPVLGSIPGIGRIFRSDAKNLQATNLVIFLTARTIKPDGGEVGEIFDPRTTREMEIQKNDLPGFRDGSDPFFTPPPEEPKKKGWFSKS